MKNYLFSAAINLIVISCGNKVKKADLISFTPDSTPVSAQQVSYKLKAKEVYDTMVRFYAIPGTDLFRENFPKQAGEPQAAYFWSHTGMFTAAVLLQSLGFSDSSFQRCIDGMDAYWDSIRQPAGYQSAPVQYGPTDRFYDDNATAGLDLVEAYQLTGKQKFLDKAEACLAFDLSGETADEGGGLFWDEQTRSNINDPNCIKATNATAFAATLAFRLYQITQKQAYLDFGTRLYNWNKSHMQDPADKLYWNDIALKDGTVNKTKWTYNAGEIITNACLLYKITKDSAYLKEAQQLAQSSYTYFTNNVAGKGIFFPSHDPWFTAILFRGYLDLYDLDKNSFYINAVISDVDYAWEHSVTTNGFFMEDWAGQYPGRYYWILNQAAMVEIYARIAVLKG